MGKTKEGEVQDAKERKENERQEAQKRGTDLIRDGKRGISISSPETREGNWKHPRTRRGGGIRKMQPEEIWSISKNTVNDNPLSIHVNTGFKMG